MIEKLNIKGKGEKSMLSDVLDQIEERGRKIGVTQGREIGITEGRKLGKSEGRKNTLKQVIKQMIKNNLPDNLIKKISGASDEEIDKIKREIKVM